MDRQVKNRVGRVTGNRQIFWLSLMAHMSFPCHEGPPATKGHFSSEPAVAGRGRYYCIAFFKSKISSHSSHTCAHNNYITSTPTFAELCLQVT